MKMIPIRVGRCTLVGYSTKNGFPIKRGNCFDLIDIDGSSHRIVNFGYENLEEWMKRSGQVDIHVRCIPKSDTLWEICDERIPNEWYNKEYCTRCTPIRLLPFEQRKEYLKGKKFTKTKEGYLISSTPIVPKDRKLNSDWTVEIDQSIVYASYIPKIKN